MLKSWGWMGGWMGGVVAHEILVSAQGPLDLVLVLQGLGLRVWGQGLTILGSHSSRCWIFFLSQAFRPCQIFRMTPRKILRCLAIFSVGNFWKNPFFMLF